MPDASRTRALRVLVAAVVVVILAGALAGIGLARLSGNALSKHQALAGERAQLLGAAGQLAVDFTSIDYRNLNAEFQNTASHATPDFAKKYLATVKAFAPLYRRGKVVQTTSVDTAGIAALSGDSAVVLVALKGVSTNTAAPNGSVQLFRMQVDLAKQGSTWLAANVQPI